MTHSAIRPCTPDDFESIYAIINDAARAYRGVIPADCYHEPYMPREELCEAIRAGVVFWGCEEPCSLGRSPSSNTSDVDTGAAPSLRRSASWLASWGSRTSRT